MDFLHSGGVGIIGFNWDSQDFICQYHRLHILYRQMFIESSYQTLINYFLKYS